MNKILVLTAFALVTVTGAAQDHPNGSVVDQLLDRPLYSTVVDGDIFLQRDLTDYLNVVLGPESTLDAGTDIESDARRHDASIVKSYFMRPHPSVSTMGKYFERAANEFGVPASLLMAVGQVESNWTHVGPSVDYGWGVMHLVQNNYCDTLGAAARLIGVSEQVLKDDPAQNIRGAAALIAEYAGPDRQDLPNLAAWSPALARFSGLLTGDLQLLQAEHYLATLTEGVVAKTVWGELVTIPKTDTGYADNDLLSATPTFRPQPQSVDYAPALTDFAPSCNYASGRNHTIDTWVNHWIGTGTYLGTISWFNTCPGSGPGQRGYIPGTTTLFGASSAHFVVKNSNGEITQMVGVANSAYHSGASGYPYNNGRSIGVEHEATAANPGMWNSVAMLNASATMARYFKDQYGFATTQNASPGIAGHNDMPGTSTTCPGPLPWTTWMSYFNAGGTTTPSVTLTTRQVSSSSVIKNQSFSVSTTLRVDSATAEHAGISISFPSLTTPGKSGNSYSSTQGTVSTSTVSSGATQLYLDGAVDAMSCRNNTCVNKNHLLAEADWSNVGAGSSKSFNLTVTPKVTGSFLVRIRAWVTTGGYANAWRDPSSGGVDQQNFWVYEYTVVVSESSPTCYTLTRTHSGQGSDPTASPQNSSGCGSGQYVAGEGITLTASPASGWDVSGWSGTNNNSSTSSTNSVTMPAANRTVSVTYAQNTPTCYTLTRTHTGSGSDPIASPANSSGCGSGLYVAGASITLTASPSSGWIVNGWSGTNNDLSTSTTNSLTMPSSNRTVSVAYSQIPPTCYALSRTHTGSGSDPTASPASSSGCSSGLYVAGASITLTASPASGWSVSGWSGTNSDASTSTTNYLTMPASNRTVGVSYSQTQPTCYALTRTHSGSGSDPTASPTNSSGCNTGQYVAGETIALTASPASGWSVSGWVGTNNDGSASNSNSVTMPTANRTVSVTYSQGGATMTELIVNVGFESTTATGNSAPNWNVWPAVMSVQPLIRVGQSYPHNGANYAYLAGTDSIEYDIIAQTIAIPASATAVSASFWVNIVTDETLGGGAYDYLFVGLYDLTGAWVADVAQVSNEDAVYSNDTYGAYFKVGPIDLTAYKGQTLQFAFLAYTDSTLPTSFLVDDVSVQVTSVDAAPITSITAPADGAAVSGTVNVTATATDDIGVTSLAIEIDGVQRASTTSATSLTYSWNTSAWANGPHTIVSKAGDTAGQVTTSTTVTVTVSNVAPPTSVVATAISASQVQVNWNAASGANSYQVFRSFLNGGYTLAGTVAVPPFPDTGRAANTTYLYYVRSVGAASNVSSPSNVDLATTIAFTDDPLVAHTSIVKVSHVNELRAAVNVVRAASGLGAASFAETIAAGVPVRASHIVELRVGLNQALTALGFALPIYSQSVLAAGSTIHASDLNELRTAVK